jgi:hypothetical protein
MSIENLPVWSVYPDWSDGVTETLEFLTTVSVSPTAVEQRRGLRLTPRQSFEFSYALSGPDRTYFDMLAMRSGGSPVWLPLWHDVELLPFTHNAGATVLTVNTNYTEFLNTGWVFIGGTYDFELAEITVWGEDFIGLANPIVSTWPQGTRVVPLKKCKLDQQPSTTRRSARVHVARVRFISLQHNRTDVRSALTTFGLQYVLEEDPNEAEDLSYTYERVWSTLDNTTGLPYFVDATGQILQKFAWYAKGRYEHQRVRSVFYALDGRRMPIWVPTIYSDFEPVHAIGAPDLYLDVKRCGYTEMGGPGPQREYILIHARSGARHYRKISDSVVMGDGTERLFLYEPLGVHLEISQIRRISFLVLSRLDQDTVEITHHTATHGLCTVAAVFRSFVAADGIEDVIEVPPGTVPPIICLNQFKWYTDSPQVNVGNQLLMRPDRLDVYDNLYLIDNNGYHFSIYSPDGAFLRIYDGRDLGQMINDWYGGPIFTMESPDSYKHVMVTPIRQGDYLLIYVATASVGSAYDQWWMLAEPGKDGSIACKGAYYNLNLLLPYINGIRIYEVWDDNSAIVFGCYTAVGSNTATLAVLPSINEFRNKTYIGGFSTVPCRVPTTILYPLGNEVDLSNKFFSAVPGNSNRNFGFKLPGNGREILYVYFSRDMLDFQTTDNFFCPEIRNVIQPAYPLGALLKMPLGDISNYAAMASMVHPTFTSFSGRTMPDYSIDNASWQDAEGAPMIPFLDEYSHISDDTTGGKDRYSTFVNVQSRSNGTYWVTFFMTGVDDAMNYRSKGASEAWVSPWYGRARVFSYTPATEIAVQVHQHTCSLFTKENITNTTSGSPFSLADNTDAPTIEIVESGDTGTLVITFPIYKTNFFQFVLPEAV